ncbi:GNAT family N-acetyltransferase [Vibrio cidicii]|uniref:GNAT family N-acetyltransferase n=2 Tax=Vibrio cidicii TaxID=1763883 RepID=UPI003704D138
MFPISFERVYGPRHSCFDRAFNLYQNSFPVYEQRFKIDQIDVLSDCEYHFELVMSEGEFLGILLTWETTDFIYIEHLAIVPEKRGYNIGSYVLDCLKQSAEKPVILEIDPPKDPVSIKRKEFYEKSGFIESLLTHKHPPYRIGWDAHELKIMSYPQISDEVYLSFKNYLENHVMKYAEAHRS